MKVQSLLTFRKMLSPAFVATMLLFHISCDKEETAPLSALNTRAKPNKIFGYYTTKIDSAMMETQAEFSNMVDIGIGFTPETKARGIEMLKLAQTKGLKAKLNLRPVMFQLRDPDAANLRVWNQMVAALKPYEKAIGAFYSSDEPYWASWTEAGGGDPWTLSAKQKLAASREKKVSQERVNAALKAAFPGIPLVLVEAWTVVDAHRKGVVPWEIPEGYDWIGTDCYEGTFDNCNGTPIRDYYATIRSLLKPGQKMILIPPGHIQFAQDETPVPSAEQKAAHATLMEKYKNFALEDIRIVGMWPWKYNSKVEGGRQYVGYLDLPPDVQKVYQDVGKALTGK